MERIKDILYDISDIVLSLIIVALIFAVVSFKIFDAMSLDKLVMPHTSTEPTKKPTAPPDQSATTQPAGNSVSPDAEVVTVNVGDAANSGTMTDDAKPGSTPTAPAGTSITLEIKSGASGYSIAKQLKEQGLIGDINTFIKRVEEKKAGTKLRSGTFKFTGGMSLDEVIKVLTGK